MGSNLRRVMCLEGVSLSTPSCNLIIHLCHDGPLLDSLSHSGITPPSISVHRLRQATDFRLEYHRHDRRIGKSRLSRRARRQVPLWLLRDRDSRDLRCTQGRRVTGRRRRRRKVRLFVRCRTVRRSRRGLP